MGRYTEVGPLTSATREADACIAFSPPEAAALPLTPRPLSP